MKSFAHPNVIAGEAPTLSPFAPRIAGRLGQAAQVGAVPDADSGRGVHGVAVRDSPERGASNAMKTLAREKLDVVNTSRRNPALRDWRGPYTPEFVAAL